MMNRTNSSLHLAEGVKRSPRQRLLPKAELLLATAPALTVLSVMALVEVLGQQRLLFASLATSAFLIYLDPHNRSNNVRALILSQLMAALIGSLANFALGAGYISGAVAMVTTTVVMIVLDLVHPPAVSTSLMFAFLADSKGDLALFGLAVGIIALLIGIERFALRILAHLTQNQSQV